MKDLRLRFLRRRKTAYVSVEDICAVIKALEDYWPETQKEEVLAALRHSILDAYARAG